MTSTIVSLADASPANEALIWAGDMQPALDRTGTGTLWERLQDNTNMDSPFARSVASLPLYTYRIADAFNKVFLARYYANREQGMPVAEAPEAYRSGRIVAGVLYGNRVSAPYEATPTHRVEPN